MPAIARSFRFVLVAACLALSSSCAHGAAGAPAPSAAMRAAGDACPAQDIITPADTPPTMKVEGRLRLSDKEVTQLLRARAELRVLIDERGHPVPCTLRVVNGSDKRLVPAATNALLASTFDPGRLNGKAVPVWLTVPYLMQ